MNDLLTAFRDQATACENLDSPFMGRLCTTLADHWPSDTALAQKCRQFEGDLGPAAVSLPLRIAGGLHALKLNGDPNLTSIYPPNTPDTASFRDGILDAIYTHDAMLTNWIDSPPQTNELRRSAVLIAAAHVAAGAYDLPIFLSELGASGGLNLLWDQIALVTPNRRFGPRDAAVTLTPSWNGTPPPEAQPRIAERRGVDLTPLDPQNSDDLLRLMAFLWPDQPHRLTMTKAIVEAGSAVVDQGDAIEWLEQRLKAAPLGHLHMIQNTVAWQYFPQDAQDRGREMIEIAGARATPDRPLAWVQMETDGDRSGLGGAAITLQMWPGGKLHNLGRADFHGRWVRWTNPTDSLT